MNPENKKLVLFDFDGVLANTLEFCFDINKEHNSDFTWEKFRNFSIGNFVDGVEKAVSENSHVVPPNLKEKYQEEIKKIKVHDVLHQAVLDLSKDYILAVVSSTTSKYISDFLVKENLRDCFSDILGVDVEKNKTIKINNIMKKYDALPSDVVFITDSLGYILEGNECGVNSIGVTWGIHDKETLEKGKPIAIINDPRELLETIEKVLSA
jgi:phosphoglycolate phosphatase